MLEIFFRKERQLESLIYGYLDNLGMVLKHFAKAMNMCLDEGLCDNFRFLTDQTHKC